MAVAMEAKLGVQNVSRRWNQYGLDRRGKKSQEGPSISVIKEDQV